MTSPVLFGIEPRLVGKSLEAALAEYMRVPNEEGRSLTVVYIKSEGTWTRLALDAGTIHWRPLEGEPRSLGYSNDRLAYDLEDIGAQNGLVGSTVLELKAIANGTAARVELQLSEQCALVLVNEGDETTVSVRQSS